MTGDHSAVLVLGGTGHYGRKIVGSLLDKGVPVRVLSRSAARAREAVGDKAEIMEGDITSRASVVQALAGAGSVVICVSAFSPELIRQLERIERDSVLMVLEEMERAGVPRVVYISVYDIREDVAEKFHMSVARVKLEVESALARSALAWTVLGAAPSMDIFFAMIRGGTMMVPGGGPPALPTVSPADVGEIAAQTVLRGDLSNRRLRMVGPEAISFPEAAKRISTVWGKTIRFRRIPVFPLQLASIVAGPMNPYLRHVVASIRLMNEFPPDIAAQAQSDHQRLLATFGYTPTTLEMEASCRRELT